MEYWGAFCHSSLLLACRAGGLQSQPVLSCLFDWAQQGRQGELVRAPTGSSMDGSFILLTRSLAFSPIQINFNHQSTRRLCLSISQLSIVHQRRLHKRKHRLGYSRHWHWRAPRWR